MIDSPLRGQRAGASLSVAVAQFAAIADVTSNISSLEFFAEAAAREGAEVVVFPEASMYSFNASAADIANCARRDGEHFEAAIRGLAARLGLVIVAGMYADSGGPLARNVFIVAGPDGKRLGSYEKLHLYDAFHNRESEKSVRAPLLDDFAEACIFEYGGLRFGLMAAYDLRFPEMARVLIDRGANVLLVGADWVSGPLKELHWETLLRARAIENTCFVAASCQSPPLSVGMSMIVDPNGLPMATVAGDSGVAVARLSEARLRSVREALPCLEHRRYRVGQRDEAASAPLRMT